ncbi:hypothetical protein Tco_0898176, partial [Tanacetum coccineum]
EVQLQALVDGKKIIVTEASVRSDLQQDDKEGMDCLPNATIFEELTRMSSKTTAWNDFSSTMASTIIYFATNQKFNFSKYIFESMVKNLKNVSGKFFMYPSGPTTNVADEAVNEEMDGSLVRAATTASSLEAEHDIGGGPRHQETIGDTIAQTRSENVSKLSNDPLLVRVINLKKTKTSQAQKITSLKRRVKRLEKKGGSITHGLKRLYKVSLSRRVESSDEEGLGEEDVSKQGRIAKINADAGINLVSAHFDADIDMFGVNDLVGDEVVVESEVDIKAVSTILVSAATTTTTVITNDDITFTKALAEQNSAKLPTITTATTITAVSTRPRAKGLARVEADYQVAQRLQAQEKEELTDEEKARLFVQFLEQRRKHFAAKRAKEKRNRPPTRAQQRKLFDKAMKRVNTFVEMDTELVEGSEVRAEVKIAQESSSKRAGTELEQESIKKQKVDEDKETAELQRLIEVVPDKEEVAIDAIPLETKPPSIVDYKIHKEGKKTYYQIIRADGSSKMYLVFSHMLKSFDREDLETLWKLVKAKHGSTRPEEGYERVLWGDLKTMFDPHVEDRFWRNQQDYRVLD